MNWKVDDSGQRLVRPLIVTTGSRAAMGRPSASVMGTAGNCLPFLAAVER